MSRKVNNKKPGSIKRKGTHPRKVRCGSVPVFMLKNQLRYSPWYEFLKFV